MIQKSKDSAAIISMLSEAGLLKACFCTISGKEFAKVVSGETSRYYMVDENRGIKLMGKQPAYYVEENLAVIESGVLGCGVIGNIVVAASDIKKAESRVDDIEALHQPGARVEDIEFSSRPGSKVLRITIHSTLKEVDKMLILLDEVERVFKEHAAKKVQLRR